MIPSVLMRLAPTAALIVLLTICAYASPDSVDGQFRPVLATFHETWNGHDARAFAAMFAADGLITTVGGTRIQGREQIERYLQPLFTGPIFKDSTHEATIKSARLVSPDIAIIDLDWGMTGARSRDGSPRPLRKGTLNWVVIRRNGRWEIVSYHNSQFAQPSLPLR
jgi:uncharacterized protein (TIGR02246 family)